MEISFNLRNDILDRFKRDLEQPFNPNKKYFIGVDYNKFFDHAFGFSELMYRVLRYYIDKDKTINYIEQILDQDIEQLNKNCNGLTALMFACMYSGTLSHINVVKTLLKYNPDIYVLRERTNKEIKKYNTPKYYYIDTLSLTVESYPYFCPFNAIKFLLNYGKSKEQEYTNEMRKEYYRIHKTKKTVFHKLMSTHIRSITPLFMAAALSQFDTVNLLLKYGIDPHYIDMNNDSVMNYVGCDQMEEMLQHYFI